MPDTLGVTANEERIGAPAWSPVSPSVRRACSTMNRRRSARWTGSAEEANADAYRDLLHEIDRAFDGFDRSAVRHGWMADHGLNADAAQMAAAAAAQRRSDALLGHVDLPDFVAAAIAAKPVAHAAGRSVSAASGRLARGLDDLPGFDREQPYAPVSRATGPDCATGKDARWRFSAARIRWCDVPSRRVQRVAGAAWDNRVSVARADAGASPAVLLTFSAEMRSAARTRVPADHRRAVAAQCGAMEVNGSRSAGCDLRRRIDVASAEDVWQTCSRIGCRSVRRRPSRSRARRCSAMAAGSRRIISVKANAKRATCRTGCAGARMTSAVHSCRGRATCLVRPRLVRTGDCCPHRLNGWRRSRPTAAIRRRDGARRTVSSSCSSAAPGARGACGFVATGSAFRSACSCWCRRTWRMTLDLRDCLFSGPALPEPFVHFELTAQLARLRLAVRSEGKHFEQNWRRSAAPVPFQRRSAECLQPCRRAVGRTPGVRCSGATG